MEAKIICDTTDIKYTVKTIRIKDFSVYQKDKRQKNEVFIVKKAKGSEAFVPSQLTSYLKTMCSQSSENTKIKEGRTICQFINFINDEIDRGYNELFTTLKTTGLYGLNLYHLCDFLNSLKYEVSYATVKDKEGILLKFYDYLYQIGITGEDAKIERVPTPIKSKQNENTQAKMQIVNPFKNNPNMKVQYPNIEEKNSNVLKNMNEELWNDFLDFAEDKYSNIAFGVALQICGGLRQGEAVNLTIDALTPFRDKNYIEIDVDDRQRELFLSRGVKTECSQVKRPRPMQPAFNFNGKLFDMLDKHLENLKNNPKRTNDNALFINSYGDPMTGEVYQKEFKRLKQDFIEKLQKTKPSKAKELREKSWGSHIGRHIFTNHLIEKGYLKNIVGYNDPKLLMILRGDKSIKSAEVYIDLKTVTEAVASEINVVSAIALATRN